MSFKNALSALVDRMFRHADLDEALGLDDLTRLERGLPPNGESGSMPAPDFGNDDPTMELTPLARLGEAPRTVALNPEPASPPSHDPWRDATITPDEGWLSKGWTLPEDRVEPESLPVSGAIETAPPPPTSKSEEPVRLMIPVSDRPPPARDMFTDIETLPVATMTFDELEATDSNPLETRPPVRPTEEITGRFGAALKEADGG
jgi:hypothetical protein